MACGFINVFTYLLIYLLKFHVAEKLSEGALIASQGPAVQLFQDLFMYLIYIYSLLSAHCSLHIFRSQDSIDCSQRFLGTVQQSVVTEGGSVATLWSVFETVEEDQEQFSASNINTFNLTFFFYQT